jgi:1,4-alpha-glucan branching enzyme
MGSIPFAGGITFRVWAPNATAVAIGFGDDPSAPSTTSLLSAEPGGVWSADILGAAPGQVYTYLLTTPAGRLTRVDPYARRVLNKGNDAIASISYDEAAFDWGSAPYQSPGWTELVVYELHIGSFNPQPGKQVGTFDDAAAKLPYLQQLGINAVELLPVAEFEGSQSWGYDPGVPFTVATAYGGPDSLKSFVRRAHELGIAVILDVVYNHLGPPDSILWQFDGSGPGWEGGIYFYGTRYPGDPRPQTPWGSRPDYGRAVVRQYLRDNALAWLEDYRIDGLRLDATAYIRNATGGTDPGQDIADGWLLLQEINDDIASAQPWKITIAEDMRGNDWITRPTASGGAGFDAQWDADFVQQVRSALVATDDAQRDMTSVQAMLERRYAPTAFARVVFTESHDADGNGSTRVPTEIDPDQPDSWWSKKRSTLGAAIVFTAPGIPMLFQGQEFLDMHPFLQLATPPDWTNVSTYAGILALYRDLIHLRRNWFDTTRGLRGEGLNVHHVNNTDKVMAFHRWDAGGAGDDVVVVLNFANRGYESYTVGLPRAGHWRVRLNSDWSGYDPGFADWPSYDIATAATPRDGLDFSGNVGLGPYTAIILSQDS